MTIIMMIVLCLSGCSHWIIEVLDSPHMRYNLVLITCSFLTNSWNKSFSFGRQPTSSKLYYILCLSAAVFLCFTLSYCSTDAGRHLFRRPRWPRPPASGTYISRHFLPERLARARPAEAILLRRNSPTSFLLFSVPRPTHFRLTDRRQWQTPTATGHGGLLPHNFLGVRDSGWLHFLYAKMPGSSAWDAHWGCAPHIHSHSQLLHPPDL